MIKQEWDELAKRDRDEYLKQYRKFMYNEGNYWKCEECPENIGAYSSFEYLLPCGQYNCWLADETKKCKVGDELWLFNTTYCLKIKGWWDGEYCCPLPDAIILKTTKKKQREVLGGTRC